MVPTHCLCKSRFRTVCCVADVFTKITQKKDAHNSDTEMKLELGDVDADVDVVEDARRCCRGDRCVWRS